MALNISSADAWTRACDRYIEDLSGDEKQLFLNASLETIFYSASAAKKFHQSNVASQLQTFAAAIEQYGTALDLASEFGKYFDRIVGMFERIGDVLPQFRVYERLFSNHERLVQALSVVYVDILKFCTDAKAVFRKGRRSTVVNLKIAMKLLWKPFDQQFGKTIEDFRKHLKMVNKEAGLSHMVEAHDARAVEQLNRMQIQKQRKEDERLRLLSTLSPTKPEKTHHRLQRLRHPQTGTWLTDSDEFRKWKSSPESYCLCCDGIPGSGKTVLASHVVDTLLGEIDYEDSALSYFYCQYSDSKTLETFNVFGSVLQQLLSRKPTLPEEVASTIKQIYADGMSLPSREDLIELVRSVLSLYSRTYVVIDGLDECGKDAQEDILFIVKALASFNKAIVKVVVFSRENAHLSTVLKHYPCVHTSEAALTRDIISFVQATVESKLEAGELVIRNPALKEMIISELITKAQGMFLWVSFQLEEICEVGQSDASIREALGNLPIGLAETYTRILKKIENKPPRITKTAQNMLKWVVCARRPLLIDELKEAIAFEPGDPSWDSEKIPAESNGKRFVQICGNLMLLDEEEGTVRLAHHTVQQYLLSTPKSSTSHHFHFQLSEAQLYAGEVCVTYLSFSDFETQIAASKPRQLAPSGILSPAGLAYIPSVMGYGSRVFDIWYRLRGGDANHQSPCIDYTPILMPKSYQKKPAGRSLQQKYRFLNYTIENWLFHTSSFSAHNTKLWGSFRSLSVEKTLAFEFRDWDSNEGPNPIPSWTLYQWASREGHGPLIGLLREPSPLHPLSHTYLDYDTSLDEKLLHFAVHGHADVLEQFLRCRPGKLGTAAEGMLRVGIQNGDEAIVRLVVGNGDRFETNIALNESFLCAAGKGHTMLVLLLLKYGAQVRERDSEGRTALHTAAMYGHETTVKALLKAGADIGTQTYVSRETALHFAAREGHAKLAQLLVDSGAAIEARDISGYTALVCAASNGHKAVMQTLLELGANVNASTSAGKTALHMAARRRHAGLIQLLVDSGADVEVRTFDGWTPLHYVASLGHKAVMQKLLDLGADINACESEGRTALYLASTNEQPELVELLLARVARGVKTERTDSGNTPLFQAKCNSF